MSTDPLARLRQGVELHQRTVSEVQARDEQVRRLRLLCDRAAGYCPDRPLGDWMAGRVVPIPWEDIWLDLGKAVADNGADRRLAALAPECPEHAQAIALVRVACCQKRKPMREALDLVGQADVAYRRSVMEQVRRVCAQVLEPAPYQLATPADRSQKDDWPPAHGWHLRPGEAAYGGRAFPLGGAGWKLLARLAQRPGAAVDIAELKQACGNSDMDDGTLRSHLSRLRTVLRRQLNLPAGENPIRIADRTAKAPAYLLSLR